MISPRAFGMEFIEARIAVEIFSAGVTDSLGLLFITGHAFLL